MFLQVNNISYMISISFPFYTMFSVNEHQLGLAWPEMVQQGYYYRPPEGGRLYDMKVVSGYAFLRTYYV